MRNTFRQTMASLLCAALAATGCATTGTTPVALTNTPGGNASNGVLAEYVQKLPPGTQVRIGRIQGHSIRGTLMKATDQSLFIQPKTRVAEPMIEIPMTEVLEVVPEHSGGNSVGRAIGAGAAAGAAATLAIFLIMFAVYGD